MEKKRIVAIVNGSYYTRAIVRRLITSESTNSINILIFGGCQEFYYRWYKNLGIPIIKNIRAINIADTVILAVGENEADNLLKQMLSVKFVNNSEQEIISFVPNLTTAEIRSSILGNKKTNVIRAMAPHRLPDDGTGFILAGSKSTLLEGLGRVTIMPLLAIR